MVRQTLERAGVNVDELLSQLIRSAAVEHTTSGRETYTGLTRRELEVLHYMALGYLNKQIAYILDLRPNTLKNHVTGILRKLNAHGRTHAVVIAVRKGLVSIDVE